MYKTRINKYERNRFGLIPGSKIHADNILQFPSYYPSMAVYRWFKPESDLDITHLEQGIQETREPAEIDLGLYDHQKVTYNFINSKPSCLIADAPGVGKTLPVIQSIPKSGKSLIIAPASLLVSAWGKQFDEFRPEIKYSIVRGSKRQREKQLATEADVYIISYESARTHSSLARYGSVKMSKIDKTDKELNQHWDLLILDEAHRIKSPKSKTARMCWKLSTDADKRIALTGTPVSNSPIDIWSILRFLDPKIWTSRSKFIDLFLETFVERYGFREITKIGGVFPEMQPLFDKIMNFYMLYRTLDEVADPPDVIYETRHCQLAGVQKKQYKQLLKESQIYTVDGSDYVIEAEPLVKSIRLHQISQAAIDLIPNKEADQGYDIKLGAASTKIALLKDTLQDLDGSVIVFSQSKQLARLGHAMIEDAEIIDGDVKGEQREQLIDSFQNKDFNVLFATLGALSEGVTLTAASTIVFLQRSFSLVDSIQAEARIRRLGTEYRFVRVIDLVCEDTVDELPAAAIRDKTAMFKQIVTDPAKRISWAEETFSKKS